MNHLEPIKNILVCPACRGGLRIDQHDITCVNCKQVYPIHESIPQFAIYKNDEAAIKKVVARFKCGCCGMYKIISSSADFQTKRRFARRAMARNMTFRKGPNHHKSQQVSQLFPEV